VLAWAVMEVEVEGAPAVPLAMVTTVQATHLKLHQQSLHIDCPLS
jgi:hypothetical protein